MSAVAARGALVHASPARGTVRVICADAPNVAPLFNHSATVTMIAERLNGDSWAAVPSSREYLPPRVKAAFDPFDILNRGILGVAP